MSAGPVVIHGAACELGEHVVEHRDAFRFAEKLVEFRMPESATVWGWGSFHRTSRSRAELAVASARRTLDSAGCRAADVDAVLLCGAEFPSQVAAHADYCRTVLGELELGHAFVTGVTLGRCTTMLTAIQLAHGLVAGGAHHDVLVVASDRVVDEDDRFQSFALFSDSAASCVISTRPGGELAVRATAAVHDVPALTVDGRVNGELARLGTETLTRRSGVAPSDIATVLASNVYVPILRMSERQSGFRLDQLYLRGIALRGHCFSADPIVNLVDHRSTGAGLRTGDHVVLSSSVPGSRVSLLTEVLDLAPLSRSLAGQGVDHG